MGKRVGEGKTGSGRLLEGSQVHFAFGSGIYWGATALRLVRDALAPVTPDWGIPVSASFFVFLVSVPMCLALFLLRSRLGKPEFQKMLALIALVCGLCSLASTGLMVLDVGSGCPLAVLSAGKAVAMNVSAALLMLLWGLAFVSLSKRQAARLVAVSAFAGAIVYAAGSCVADAFLSSLASEVLLVVSMLFLLRILPVRLCPPVALAPRRRLILFYLSRVGFGVGIGVALVAVRGVRNASRPVVSLLCCATLLLILLVAAKPLSRKVAGRESVVLPCVPLLLMGIVLVPYLGGSIETASAAGAAVVWWSWIALSSVQLSELKKTFGMGDAALVVSEKLTIVASWPAGVYAASLLGLDGMTFDAVVSPGIAFGVAYLAVLFSTFSLLMLMMARERQTVIQEVSERVDEGLAHVYEAIARDFGLTAREGEVLSLVAQGHTRSFIGEELFISDGTVRSHIRNVYRKLGCHKKEELYLLVERYKRPIDNA